MLETFTVLLFVGAGLVALLAVVLFITSLISILASPRYTGGAKILWIIGVFVFPVAGPLVWFLGGRTARIRTDLP